jgi:hypothetical protein
MSSLFPSSSGCLPHDPATQFAAFAHPRVAFVADPKGNLRAKLLSTVPGVMVEELPLAEVDRTMLGDRRPELYGALTDGAPANPG